MSDMRILRIFPLFILLFSLTKAVAQQKNYVIHTLAFYNFENLFDTIIDLNINDA